MMRPSSYATIRLLAVLFTVLVIVVHQYLPPKTLHLYPGPDRLTWLYGPDSQGVSSAGWINQEHGQFWCNYAADDPYSCGWNLNLGPDRMQGLDLSGFDGLNILMHYTGDSARVRLYLRNFDPAYSDVDTFDVSSKTMTSVIRTSNLGKPIYVRLSEFNVAEWWIAEFDVAREYHAPSFDNVILMGLEFIESSSNEIQIEKIEALGEWVEKETLYFGIIIVWMALIVLEVFSRFYQIHKKAQMDAMRLNRLASDYKKVELEKQEFEKLSATDVLTGAMNRAGIEQFLQRLFGCDADGGQVGLLFLDIDHFKEINDQFGHDVGDIVLVQLVNIIRQNVRQSDVIGRWGGEEFILLCPNVSEQGLSAFAEKIREAIEQHVFETQAHALRVTVSIGAIAVKSEERFKTAFKRADTALYRAKNSGRNRVHVERA